MWLSRDYAAAYTATAEKCFPKAFFTGFGPVTLALLQANCLLMAMIAQISMNLSINLPELIYFF
jgi:hypothetical protein